MTQQQQLLRDVQPSSVESDAPMSKLAKGTIFSTLDEAKKEVAIENAKFGRPLLLLFLRSKRRKEGLKNYYIGCGDKNCPARLVLQQKLKIDDEGLIEEFFEITACNLTHHCERVRPASGNVMVKLAADAINKLNLKFKIGL